jgi:hypothetical protein
MDQFLSAFQPKTHYLISEGVALPQISSTNMHVFEFGS